VPASPAAQQTLQQILELNRTYWNALDTATQQDMQMSGKMIEWGALDYESKVDMRLNAQRKGSVVEHPSN